MPWQSKYDSNVSAPNAPANYNPVGLYRKTFKVTDDMKAANGRVYLSFQGVESLSLIHILGEFEGNSAEFVYHPVTGTKEISALSDSFEHMAVRIQKLMEEVRQEEISLRKTELKALQAQINPHFLYNTLDAIAWMCEAGRCV